MGHRANRRQPVAHSGGNVRGAPAAGDRGRARDLHRRVGPVIATRREVDHAPARARLAAAGSEHDPGSLRRDHGLEVDLVQEQRLEQLCLDPRRCDPQQRLVWKREGALRDRVDVAREPEPCKVVGEAGAEADPVEVVELLLAEPKLGDHPHRRRQPRDEQPPAVRGQPAHEQLEHGLLVHPPLQIALRHRQLVAVDQQRHLGRREQAAVGGVRGRGGVGHGGNARR